MLTAFALEGSNLYLRHRLTSFLIRATYYDILIRIESQGYTLLTSNLPYDRLRVGKLDGGDPVLTEMITALGPNDPDG